MKIEIAGVPATVVTDAEAEKADFVVCCRVGTPSVFDDDVAGTCADCGHAIFHRPHVPMTPPKICLDCAIDRAKGGAA